MPHTTREDFERALPRRRNGATANIIIYGLLYFAIGSRALDTRLLSYHYTRADARGMLIITMREADACDVADDAADAFTRRALSTLRQRARCRARASMITPS